MAKKRCWSKIVVQDDGQGLYINYRNKNGKDTLSIQRVTGGKKTYLYKYLHSGKKPVRKTDSFKTDAQAIRNAEAFMKKHPCKR